MRNTQKGACSLAGQADCSAVTPEGVGRRVKADKGGCSKDSYHLGRGSKDTITYLFRKHLHFLIYHSLLSLFLLLFWVQRGWGGFPFTLRVIPPSREVEEIIEENYPSLSSGLGAVIAGTLTVYIASDPVQFEELVGTGFPDWGLACALPSKKAIVLTNPKETKWKRDLEEVVTHELTHILLHWDLTSVHVPRWFDEGLAMSQSQEWRMGMDFTLAKAKLTGSLLPLRAIDQVNTFWRQKADLAYAESFSALIWLEKRFGPRAVPRIIRGLKEGYSMDGAMWRAIGLGLRDCENLWFQWVKKRYNWLTLFADTSLFWLGVTLLFFIAFFLKKRKQRTILQKWKREETFLISSDDEDDPLSP